MQIEKRLRGRPRKKDETIQPLQFARAALAMCAYDEARARGEKHSVAVAQATYFVKKRHPEMRISETEVKRVLATWRPRSAGTILRFERSVLTEEKIKKFRWIREQQATLRRKRGLILPVPPNYDLGPTFAAFTIRFAERPNYPRHNRKNPNE